MRGGVGERWGEGRGVDGLEVRHRGPLYVLGASWHDVGLWGTQRKDKVKGKIEIAVGWRYEEMGRVGW